MALIPTVGRRSLKLRLVVGLLYLALTLGAVTMVYPFLLMLGTSITSEADYTDFRPFPRYLTDDGALFAKEAEARFSADMLALNRHYGTDFASLRAVQPPQALPRSAAVRAVVTQWNSTRNYFEGQVRKMDAVKLPYLDPRDPHIRAQVDDWLEFKKTLPLTHLHASYAGWTAAPSNAPSRLLEYYRAELMKRYGSIQELNRAYVQENDTFATVLPPLGQEERREWNPPGGRRGEEWEEIRRGMPERLNAVVPVEPLFQQWLQQVRYEDDIRALNAAWGTSYTQFSEIPLTEECPEQKAQAADWEEFVRTQLSPRYIRVDASALPAWRQFLLGRHRSLATLGNVHGREYGSLEEIGFPQRLTAGSAVATDWLEFIARAAPLSALRVDSVETRYRNWLKARFGNVQKVNERYGTQYASLLQIRPPLYLTDWVYVKEHAGELRRYFALSNYRLVLDYILRHGRAVYNTFIFVTLAILTHLIVNPVCAYALSRYNLKYGHRVLLFLLATMAFPAEVAMIPSFLLLKELNLLNTFAALVLPTVANGYSIFLLKGFFDSLPRELYEAGIIDGASEGRMFWKITVPLSKPVLAVIALSSFTAAYGSFMFAFLVCQDPRMWTLMVWLYELQIASPSYVVMAALTVAAIPTLLVFVFCQNIIMRGIIIPSFK
jgi:multiple sugar transport system permease protein